MSLRLFLHVFSLQARTRMSYRADFWISTIFGLAAELGVYLFLTWALFAESGVREVRGFDQQGLVLYFVAVMLLADVDTFAKWKGALIEDRGQKILHLWGQFTAELPERFRPDGPTGHQYIELASPEEARQRMTELCEHVQATWPDAKVLQSELQAQFLRKDFKQLWPSSRR